VNGGWIDISTPIRDGMPHWPGDPDVRVWRFSSIEYGGANVTALSMCAHTGTHVDAPLHYVPGGASVDELPPEVGLGPARVVAEAPGDCRPGERILFKGSALTLEAARQLARAGLRLAGVDSLSAGPAGAEGDEIHRVLLEAGVWILEGLDLSAVEPGQYELLCLPLRIAGADGAPARAFLRPIE
jgi:arylformamidase